MARVSVKLGFALLLCFNFHVSANNFQYYCGRGVDGCMDSDRDRAYLQDLDMGGGAFVKPAKSQFVHYSFVGVHQGVREAIIVEGEIPTLPTLINFVLACERVQSPFKWAGLSFHSGSKQIELRRQQYKELCQDGEQKILASMPWLHVMLPNRFSLDLKTHLKTFYTVGTAGWLNLVTPNPRTKRGFLALIVHGVSLVVPFIFGLSSTLAARETIKSQGLDQFPRGNDFSPYYSLGPMDEAYINEQVLNALEKRRIDMNTGDRAYYYTFKDIDRAEAMTDHLLSDVATVMQGRLPPSAFMPGQIANRFTSIKEAAAKKDLELTIPSFEGIFRLDTGYKFNPSSMTVSTSTYMEATIKNTAADLFEFQEYPIERKDGSVVMPKMPKTIIRKDAKGDITLVHKDALHACDISEGLFKCSNSLTTLSSGAVRDLDRLCALAYYKQNSTEIITYCRFGPGPTFDRHQAFALDKHFVYLHDKQAVTNHCPGTVPVSKHLSGNLIIAVTPGCKVTTDHFQFHSFSRFTGSMPYVMLHLMDKFLSSPEEELLSVLTKDTIISDASFNSKGYTVQEADNLDDTNGWNKFFADISVWMYVSVGAAVALVLVGFLAAYKFIKCTSRSTEQAKTLPPRKKNGNEQEMPMPMVYTTRQALFHMSKNTLFKRPTQTFDVENQDNTPTISRLNRLSNWTKKHHTLLGLSFLGISAILGPIYGLIDLLT